LVVPEKKNEMIRSRLLALRRPIALVVALTAAATAGARHDDCRRSFCDEGKSENISIYLKPDSKRLLKEYLEQRGIKGREVSVVCFARNAEKDERFVNRPLFGQRAAFRLKGIIETDSGMIVGVGRLSTMVGEIETYDYAASLPITPVSADSLASGVSADGAKAQTPSLAALSDLPTRFYALKGKASSLWKGRLPSSTIRGTFHPAVGGVTYTPLPQPKQIVVDGHVCSDRFVDAEGNCVYDRSEDKEELQHEASEKAASAAVEPSDETGSSGTETAGTAEKEVGSKDSKDSKDVENECPVCKYIKAGPCKAEFLDWDVCVQSMKDEDDLSKCFTLTVSMMKCMKKYEYYDIMTAGTDFGKMDDAEKAKSIPVPVEPKPSEPSDGKQ
jgi:hypothetical protein